MKYKKKPVIIEAIQWDGTYKSKLDIEEKLGCSFCGSWNTERETVNDLYISTLEGKLDVSINDFIIKGVKGEFYPCKPDIFEMTYEPVELPNTSQVESKEGE